MWRVEPAISSPFLMESLSSPSPTWFQAFVYCPPGERPAGKGAGTCWHSLDGQGPVLCPVFPSEARKEETALTLLV